MILLEAQQVELNIKDRTLLNIESLYIQTNDKIGLVGPNGSGKTSLLEILAGKRQAANGNIILNATCELLPQLKNEKTTKSGGEITNEYINYYLGLDPDILLADEPTTNLDAAHIENLEKRLKKWRSAFVIVSHDRAFLDALCTTIWEIQDGKLTVYKGNHSDYVAQKDLEKRQHEAEYEQYERKKRQLENALEMKEQKAQRATKKPKHLSASDARIKGAKPYFANKQKKLRQTAKAIETRLDKMEKVEKIREIAPVKMTLPNEDLLRARIIIRIDEVRAKVKQRTLWQTNHIGIQAGEKIALLGNNGTGKTTFLKKVLRADDGITISPAVKIGYFSQNLDVLDTDKTILENVTSSSSQDETTIRTVLARLRFFRDDVYKKINVLSGGERVKVSFAKLFVSDINTLLLDEPTNFLDIEAVEALEGLLRQYEGTVILVSHDRRFIEGIADRIFKIENQQVSVFDGTYQAFKEQNSSKSTPEEDDLLVIETKITEVLGKLSLEHSEELEATFQQLLAKKKELDG